MRSSGPEVPRLPPTPAFPLGVSPHPPPLGCQRWGPGPCALHWSGTRSGAHPRGEDPSSWGSGPRRRGSAWAGGGAPYSPASPRPSEPALAAAHPEPPLLASVSLGVQGADRHAPPLRRHGGRRARGSGDAPRPLGAAHAAPEKPRLGGVAGGLRQGRAWSWPGAHAFVRPRLRPPQPPRERPDQPRSSPQHRGRPSSPEPSDSLGGRKSSPGKRSLAQYGRGLRAEPSGKCSPTRLQSTVSMATAKRHRVGC